jgi:hypothetical protein
MFPFIPAVFGFRGLAGKALPEGTIYHPQTARTVRKSPGIHIASASNHFSYISL